MAVSKVSALDRLVEHGISEHGDVSHLIPDSMVTPVQIFGLPYQALCGVIFHDNLPESVTNEWPMCGKCLRRSLEMIEHDIINFEAHLDKYTKALRASQNARDV